MIQLLILEGHPQTNRWFNKTLKQMLSKQKKDNIGTKLLGEVTVEPGKVGHTELQIRELGNLKFISTLPKLELHQYHHPLTFNYSVCLLRLVL